MCGRYWIEDDPGEALRIIIEEANRRAQASVSVKAVGEIFPGDVAPVVCRSRSGRRMAYPMEWGFRLSDGRRVINARSETVAEKALFRESAENRRCLIPMNAYFEWERRQEARVRHRIAPETGEACFLAGLYRYEGERIAFVVLTREAAEDICFIHPRMPVILPEAQAEKWLEGGVALECTQMTFEEC